MELRMSRKERDRLKVMDQLGKGQITQQQAARWLALSVRQVRPHSAPPRAQGDRGVDSPSARSAFPTGHPRRRARARHRAFKGQIL